MTDWQSYQQGEENAAYGRFLIETVAAYFECEPTTEAVSRAAYKNTDCGAWIDFDESGILVGTIVEGIDPEYFERIDLIGIDTDDEGAALLVARVEKALLNCEDFANENWEGL